MYDSNMAPCVKDGVLTYWCCSEDMIKDAQPGNSVVSVVYYYFTDVSVICHIMMCTRSIRQQQNTYVVVDLYDTRLAMCNSKILRRYNSGLCVERYALQEQQQVRHPHWVWGKGQGDVGRDGYIQDQRAWQVAIPRPSQTVRPS